MFLGQRVKAPTSLKGRETLLTNVLAETKKLYDVTLMSHYSSSTLEGQAMTNVKTTIKASFKMDAEPELSIHNIGMFFFQSGLERIRCK